MLLSARIHRFLARSLTVLLVAGLGVVTNIAPSTAAIVLTINESDPSLVFIKANSVSITGTGTAQGDVVLYKNVGTYGGVTVDAVITTVSLSGTISNYDNPGSATAVAGSANYWMINTVGGDARFRFEFYKGGSYTGAGSGIPVVLQNVKVTSIDIDTSGTGANQYSDFTGFQKYSMMSPTNLAVIAQPTVVGEPNRIRFIANLAGSRSSAPQDQVLVKYDAVQKMEIAFGNIKAGSTNYFGLIFGGWPGTGTPVEYPNQFNTPPTSTSVTLGVSDSQTAPSVLSLAAFGQYSDVDNNPFVQVKIATLPASGSLQKFNGSTWVNLNVNDVISVTDIEDGKIQYYPASPGADTSLTFFVHDGLEYSSSPYTLTLQTKAASQVITFSVTGPKSPSQTFASGAVTTASGETVTLTSNTPGICTVNNATGEITTIGTGTCSITATQPGNSTYPAATPVTQVFQVTSKTPQVITFVNPGTKNESTTAFSSAATTNASGLFVTMVSADDTICKVTGSGTSIPNIIPSKAGTCTVTASQDGNSTYDPAVSKTVSFQIIAPGSSGGGSTSTTSTGPEVHTTGAESIVLTSPYSAYVYGLLSPRGTASMSYKFCWTASTSSSDIKTVTVRGVSTKVLQESTKNVLCSTQTAANITGENKPASTQITQFKDDDNTPSNLSRQKTYFFQVIGDISGTKYYGEVMSFYLPKSSNDWVTAKTTQVQPSDVTENSAILQGAFNSTKTSTRFSYCLTTDPKQVAIDYSSSSKLAFQNLSLSNCNIVNHTPLLSSTLPTARSESATSITFDKLQGGTWYYYQTRAYETSNKRTAYGKIIAFQTSSKSPVATTLPVSTFESTSAILPGSALSNGESSTVTFEISQNANMGSLTSINATPAKVLGFNGVSVSAKTSALAVGTRYYYRVKVIRDADSVVSTGSVSSFILGAPSVSTSSPTGLETDTVSTWKVNLNGYLKSQGFLATPSFCVGTSSTVDADGVLQGCTNESVTAVDSTTASIAFSQQIINLNPTTTYYYQAKALNREYLSAQLWAYGEVKDFTTAFAPDAITLDPTNIGSTSATLNGTVTSTGDSATVTFCLSKSDSRTPDDSTLLLNCDSRLLISENVSSTLLGTNQSGTKNVEGLAKTTTYYYQIAASNKMGSVVGDVKSFTTNAGGPIATTLPSEYVTSTSARIFGSINSNGSNSTAYFCYGTDSTTAIVDGGESMTACSNVGSAISILASNLTTVSESTTVGPVQNTTTYFYQIYAINARGERAYGKVLSFALNTPIVTTSNVVESITATSATIRGTANKNGFGSSIDGSFCLTTAEDLDLAGILADCSYPGVSFTSVTGINQLSQSVSGLTPGTEYFYQAYVADNSDRTIPLYGGRYYSFKTNALVTFDSNGETGSDSQTASSSTALKSFNLMNFATADTNTTFIKWNTSPLGTGTDYADGAIYGFTDNLVLYAIWSDPAATFTITYDLGGGSGTLPVQGNRSTGQTFNAASGSGLTKSGFTFGGWICGSTTYAAGALVTVGSANITCTAIWNAVVAPSTPTVKKKLVLRWSNPSSINFGTPLSGGQLNGATDAAATCVYTPAAGTILVPGEYTLSVTCTPVDGSNYEAVTGTVKLTVKKVKGKPRVIWFNPSPITYPAPLTSVQLNAVASKPGTYEYNPAAGTILAPGRHKLKVKFVPSDKEEDEEIEANVTIDVLAPKVPATTKPGETTTATVDTSTITVAPVVPTKPAQAADTKTAEAPTLVPVFQTAGKTEVVTIKPNEDKTGIIVSSDDWSLQIKSTTQFVQGNTQDTSSRVVIEKGNTVTTSGTGFKPFSQVDVYVYSTPTWLGAVMTDEFGNFTTTLPMPKALPEGDHTFQAKGITPDDSTRKAEIPITLVPAVEVNKPGSMRFEVYFAMNGVVITKAEKAKTQNMVKIAKSRIAAGAKVSVAISGWVQPNPNPGNVTYLSTNRAKNVRTLLQSLGLKGTYTLKFPGLDKDNIPSARHASVVINWSKSK